MSQRGKNDAKFNTGQFSLQLCMKLTTIKDQKKLYIFYEQDVARKKSVKNSENNSFIAQQLGKLSFKFIQRICLKLKTKPTQEPGMQHSQDNLVVQKLHQYFLFKHGSIHILFANFRKIAIFFIPDS